MRVTCHLVGVVQMVHANPGRNFSLRIFAYHLYKPSTNRFSHVNGKQQKLPFMITFSLKTRTSQICIFNNKNSSFARFARAFFILEHFEDLLVLSTTWNDLFCSCVDDVSIWWQMFNFVFLSLKRLFQFNSRMVRVHFASIMTLNNWEMIAETRSYIFG